jgi:steroid 5-alpha reductase family enzyme
VKRFVRVHTVEGKKYGKWSVVRLEGSYGCVDANWVFCVIALSGMARVTKVLEEYTRRT